MTFCSLWAGTIVEMLTSSPPNVKDCIWLGELTKWQVPRLKSVIQKSKPVRTSDPGTLSLCAKKANHALKRRGEWGGEGWAYRTLVLVLLPWRTQPGLLSSGPNPSSVDFPWSRPDLPNSDNLSTWELKQTTLFFLAQQNTDLLEIRKGGN